MLRLLATALLLLSLRPVLAAPSIPVAHTPLISTVVGSALVGRAQVAPTLAAPAPAAPTLAGPTLAALTAATSATVGSAVPALAAPALAGLWLTQGHDAVIAILPCDSGLCARIAGVFLDRTSDPMPVDYRGVSQCNLPLISDARQVQPNLWKGHITDPRNGSVYRMELHLDPHGNVALRGFLGIPLLGHTETWTRYGLQVPADCRIAPSGSVNGPTRTLPNRARPAQ